MNRILRTLLFALLCAIPLQMALPVQEALAIPVETLFVPNNSNTNPNIAPAAATQSQSCTNLSNMPASGDGDILSSIAAEIEDKVADIGEQMFEGIVANASFQGAVNAALVLYVTIYGALLITGITRPEPSDILIRLFKLGFIWMMLSYYWGWYYFSSLIYPFFMDGMKYLIGVFTQIAMGCGGANCGDLTSDQGPLSAVGKVFDLIFSVHFFTMLLAMILTGPYGFVLVLLVMWAVVAFIWAAIGALVAFVKAIVGLGFLFGVAPIFFTFLLFQRTRALFDGWLNQVIGFALQPVFIFAFLAFFMVMIRANLEDMMRPTVCWAKIPIFNTNLLEPHWFRFSLPGSTQPFEGTWDADGNAGVAFPIDIMNILMFWLMSMLAMNYTGYVDRLANEISGGGFSIGVAGSAVQNWFKSRGMAPMQLAKRMTVGKGIGYGKHGVGGLGGAAIGSAKWVGRQVLPQSARDIPKNAKQYAVGKAIEGSEKIFGRTITGKRAGAIYVGDRKAVLEDTKKLEDMYYRRQGIPSMAREYSKAGNGGDEITLSQTMQDMMSGKIQINDQEYATLSNVMREYSKATEIHRLDAASAAFGRELSTVVHRGTQTQYTENAKLGVDTARKLMRGKDAASKAAADNYLSTRDAFTSQYTKIANDLGTPVEKIGIENLFNRKLGERLAIGDDFGKALDYVLKNMDKPI